MKRLELTKEGKHRYLMTCGALLAEFVGTNAQGVELVAKFNQHAELVKALQCFVGPSGAHTTPTLLELVRAGALLKSIDKDYPQ